MAHALTADFCACHFNAAAFTDFALVANTLVFAAVAFPVFCRPKNTLTKQSVTFRFQSAVIDCFRFFDFAVRPFQYFFRRSKAYFYRFQCIKFHVAKSPCQSALSMSSSEISLESSSSVIFSSSPESKPFLSAGASGPSQGVPSALFTE